VQARIDTIAAVSELTWPPNDSHHRDQEILLQADAQGRPFRQPVRLSYRLEGPATAPLLLVLGGLNASREVDHWWPAQYGVEAPLNPQRWRLLSIDWADPEGQDGEQAGTAFQAAVIEALLQAEGISSLHTVIAASFGAMVALSLAERQRINIGQLLLFSGAHESHPAATLIRHLQREIVRLGELAGLPGSGLSIARGLAMSSYRTRELFARRFDVDHPEERLKEISNYLTHIGKHFARHNDPRRFIQLSESIDLHQVAPEHIFCPVTLVAVASDQLVPLEQMRELADRLAGPVSFELLNSPYGHDAFLKAHEDITAILEQVLKECRHARA